MSTAAQPLAENRFRIPNLLRDYAELTKLRVPPLIVMD